MKKNDSVGIFIPIKIGDLILTGRFKNKKTIVKTIGVDEYGMPTPIVFTIGVDEYGMPTVNGKRVMNFRIPPKEEKK